MHIEERHIEAISYLLSTLKSISACAGRFPCKRGDSIIAQTFRMMAESSKLIEALKIVDEEILDKYESMEGNK